MALRSDFVENVDELDEVIRDQGSLLAAQSRRFHRFEPVTCAYDAMVASGDLRLISSDKPRSEEGSQGLYFMGLHNRADQIVDLLVP